MKFGNQADRARRTIESVSGVRVVLPPGTGFMQVFDQQLVLIYRDRIIPEVLEAKSPFLAKMRRADTIREPLTRRVL